MKKAKREIVEYKGRYPILVLLLGLAGIVAIVIGFCIGMMFLLKWLFP